MSLTDEVRRQVVPRRWWPLLLAVVTAVVGAWAQAGGPPRVQMPRRAAPEAIRPPARPGNPVERSVAGDSAEAASEPLSVADTLSQKGSVSAGYVVLGFNDLGMHCMNQDFSEICILPPFNTLRAQVIRRGREPEVISQGVTLEYSIPGNTISSTKTNFWTYAPKLFGKPLAKDVGLTGNRLSGKLAPTKAGYFEVTGIPVTPLSDTRVQDPFRLSRLVAKVSGKVVAETKAVVPVSWEINCHLCHNTPGVSVATDILRAHDRRHGTTLERMRPVLCAGCHADAALGTPGKPGVSQFSHAMHRSHAPRMAALPNLKNNCYACHPGIQNECQRDVHAARGMVCTDCHGDMAAVAEPARRPWVDEPRCATCHESRRPGFDFEEPGRLFKDSRGHGDVACAACHGPQHATGPATTIADNAQAVQWQGKAGVISKCTVCHTTQPSQPFFHSRDDDQGDD